jgi:hypothetical protein
MSSTASCAVCVQAVDSVAVDSMCGYIPCGFFTWCCRVGLCTALTMRMHGAFSC